MIKKSIVGLVVCLLFATNARAMTLVPDTGDPDERVCNPKSYTDLGNGIVRDNVTGLEWVQDGNLIASRDPAFDNDSDTGDGAVTWQHALDYVDKLNEENYLGHIDWRLPAPDELLTLVDRSIPWPGPKIASTFFPNTAAFSYWSSAKAGYSTSTAWNVDFAYGTVTYGNKLAYNFIRAVRSRPYGSLDSFFINGDGTVTDNSTGLMWQHCNYGQTWNGTDCAGSAGTRTWQQALDYVQGLNRKHYLGYSDWRLPNTNELISIVNYGIFNPATTFPNTPDISAMGISNYWSSEIWEINPPNCGWVVDFEHGGAFSSHEETTIYVRAVRGGPCWVDNADCLDGSDCEEGTICEEGMCIECFTDNDCSEEQLCNGGMCMFPCELTITHKEIIAEKLSKPKKVTFNISGEEGFDPFGQISMSPFTWERMKFSRKKNQLKIHAIVPAGLEPGSYPISVGDCVGEIVITGTDG
jgi:Protein of unknown function (DUF1566)